MQKPLIAATPLHEQLRTEIVKRIVTGEWAPGTILPNESEIARQFGLSVGTVRKALDWIAEAQLIVRRQGRGTFVLDPKSHDVMKRRLHFYDAKTNTPIIGTIERSTLTTGVASSEEAARLQLAPEHSVYRIEQVRCMSGARLAWEQHVVPAALFPELASKPHEILVFVEFAFSHGVVVGPGREHVSYAVADKKLARELDIEVGASLLKFDRLLHTMNGVPAAWRLGWFKPDNLIYKAELT